MRNYTPIVLNLALFPIVVAALVVSDAAWAQTAKSRVYRCPIALSAFDGTGASLPLQNTKAVHLGDILSHSTWLLRLGEGDVWPTPHMECDYENAELIVPLPPSVKSCGRNEPPKGSGLSDFYCQ